MIKSFPFLPTRICLKKGFPGESSITRMAMIKMAGLTSSKHGNAINRSKVRLTKDPAELKYDVSIDKLRLSLIEYDKYLFGTNKIVKEY